MVKAAALLLTEDEVRRVFAGKIDIGGPPQRVVNQPVGEVLRQAAVDSAYEQFGGSVREGEEAHPVSVGVLALVFDPASKAGQIFDQVAAAAHLRTEVDGCEVTVETVTSSAGLVSYWAYVHRAEAIVILTLDTLDPQQVSMTEFRSLVLYAADRLGTAAPH